MRRLKAISYQIIETIKTTVKRQVMSMRYGPMGQWPTPVVACYAFPNGPHDATVVHRLTEIYETFQQLCRYADLDPEQTGFIHCLRKMFDGDRSDPDCLEIMERVYVSDNLRFSILQELIRQEDWHSSKIVQSKGPEDLLRFDDWLRQKLPLEALSPTIIEATAMHQSPPPSAT